MRTPQITTSGRDCDALSSLFQSADSRTGESALLLGVNAVRMGVASFAITISAG
jgi:hypothetical protein